MKLVPNSVSTGVARSILKSKKNSPHIFFAAGVVGIIGSTILACRATLKLEETVDEIKNDFNAVTDMSGYTELEKKKYTETEYRKDVGYVYMRGAVKLGKLYAPSIIVGGVSVAALTGSHIQLTKRNAALTATLAAVMKAYDEYRARVREVIGEEKEIELYRDVNQEMAEIEGKKQKVQTSSGKYSPYARLFDEHNVNWQPSSETNRNFLMCQQNYANQMLQARGHVMLNDVYDSLGMERSPAGAVVGWVKNGKDGYIDFNIWEGMNQRVVGNWEAAIWLDFNVDGVVYELIGEN